MAEPQVLGCIGLGVMGEPICGHLARKSGCRVLGFDLHPDPLARLAAEGVEPATGIEAVGEAANIVFLSLPGGAELAAVALRLLPAMRAGATLVDLSTSPVDLTRELAARFAARGLGYADARSRAPGQPPSGASSASWSAPRPRPSPRSSPISAALRATSCTAATSAPARSPSS